MNQEIQDLVTSYNDAVDRYNLARLEYAMLFDGFSLPPVANTMPNEGLERAERHRPATLSVQAVRDFFEDIFHGAISADTRSTAYGSLLHADDPAAMVDSVLTGRLRAGVPYEHRAAGRWP